MGCCGASNSVGLAPKAAVLLGDDDGNPPRHLLVSDSSLIPNVPSGRTVYVKGSAVDQAIEEGKLKEAPKPGGRLNSKVTKWRVTIPSGEAYDFPSWASAKKYSDRNNGVMSIIQEETDG